MKKENNIKDLSIYNINTYSSKFYNNNNNQISISNNSNFINKFKMECVIGKGGFGKVWKVKYKLNGKLYAMKIMSKVKIIKKNSVKNILNEKKLLSRLHNPFLVNMVFSFQDADNLYLIMDLLLGGDLRYHINKSTIFNEIQLKFFVSCTILGLEYLHKNNIIHKDIKPENLVFDNDGYLHITDLGISKIYHEDNSKENSGTLGYMAPEVLFNKNHDYSVDFFALGVICYEIIMGERPYSGKNKKELRKDMISKQAKLKIDEIKGWSELCINFINSLLQRKKENRLGKSGINELMDNSWFENFNWDELRNKKMKPNWKPPYEENYYHNYNKDEEIGKETELCYEEIKKRDEYQKYFQDYSFNEIDLEKKEKEKEKNKEKDLINNKKIKMKYEITSKIVKKLKEEIKKFSFSNINILTSKRNSLYKNTFLFSNIGSNRFINKDYKKNVNSSLRLTKSYYLYNFNSFKENNSLMNNISSSYNISTKYNNNNNRVKLNNISNDSKNYYKSIYSNKFLNMPKYTKKFNSIKNFLYLNKLSSYDKLPKINQLKKCSSVGNFERIKYFN